MVRSVLFPCNVETDKLLNEARPQPWRQSQYLRPTLQVVVVVVETPKEISILLLPDIVNAREVRHFSPERVDFLSRLIFSRRRNQLIVRKIIVPLYDFVRRI